ncbi:hypothetical protein [Microvirga sp. VF16]|uniref:hypothetical protein n=1 Tax=Microvirga sp. VF16 TaxID=2807101 RepID=UPI00193D453C|nr:hypothetical protein [Microvirga sp. VF16]QRM34685.1 hypothetical protein JO965_41130 [Microvirga sp. VF16]
MNTSTHRSSVSRDVGLYLRHQLRGPRARVAAAITLAVPALWLGWPWLVAVGVAPLLVSFAPCAIMCALGLCVSHTCKKADTSVASGVGEGSSTRTDIIEGAAGQSLGKDRDQPQDLLVGSVVSTRHHH